MTRERGSCRVSWVTEEPRLCFQAEALVGDSWVPIRSGRVMTQVWPHEDDELRGILLEKLLDRIEPELRKHGHLETDEMVIDNGLELFDSLQWFGPEMAEEY